jgi:hypothetical protein
MSVVARSYGGMCGAQPVSSVGTLRAAGSNLGELEERVGGGHDGHKHRHKAPQPVCPHPKSNEASTSHTVLRRKRIGFGVRVHGRQ